VLSSKETQAGPIRGGRVTGFEGGNYYKKLGKVSIPGPSLDQAQGRDKNCLTARGGPLRELGGSPILYHSWLKRTSFQTWTIRAGETITHRRLSGKKELHRKEGGLGLEMKCRPS